MIAALAVGILLPLVLAPAALAGVLAPEAGGSPNADDIRTLYWIVFVIAIPIFLIVEGTLIWSLVRYRRRRGGPPPAQIRGNTPLELSWTVGAALILVVLAVITFVYLDDITNPPPSLPGGLQNAQFASIDQPAPPRTGGPTLRVRVNGQQYLWRYEYPDLPGPNYSYYELVVPTRTTVVLEVTASDVIHSWWIPKLGGKFDAVPGYVNKTWFRISKPGRYVGQCAELCGPNHADMRAVVRAVEPAEFEAWLRRQRAEILAAQEDLSKQRRERARRGEVQ